MTDPAGKGERDLAAVTAAIAVTADSIRRADGEPTTPAQLLDALVLLRWAQTELAALEPVLVTAARAAGVSWQSLAPALGVASRQAAERRYLRSTSARTEDPGATRDDRVDSVTIFAGLTLDIPGGTFAYDSGLPLLVLHGDADDVPIGMDRAAYDQATSPKWFVTLHGAEHRLAFTDEASPYDELVTRTVLDFWHGTLDPDPAALDRVTASATDPELSTVEVG